MAFSTTYVMIPNKMPSLMESAITMVNSVMMQGMLSVCLLKFSCFTLENIIKPTMMRMGLVAPDGMARNRGAKNREMAKKKAMDAAVKPVLPPSLTPEADST